MLLVWQVGWKPLPPPIQINVIHIINDSLPVSIVRAHFSQRTSQERVNTPERKISHNPSVEHKTIILKTYLSIKLRLAKSVQLDRTLDSKG